MYSAELGKVTVVCKGETRTVKSSFGALEPHTFPMCDARSYHGRNKGSPRFRQQRRFRARKRVGALLTFFRRPTVVRRVGAHPDARTAR
ncbi:MAG: hypothetical protein IPG73_03385 [Ignavibacteria bacterium]|nr:hypothetical protein [Ignavibacteria bacterium]